MKAELIEAGKRMVAILRSHAADLDELANHCTNGERDHYRRRAQATRDEAAIEEAKLKTYNPG